MAERRTAEKLGQIWSALGTSATWREFRKRMPADELKSIEEYFAETADDDPDSPVPNDDQVFKASDLPGFDDGNFPGGWPQDLVTNWFPKDLIAKHGGDLDTTPNGYDLFLPASNLDDIVADLVELGHSVEETADLQVLVMYAYDVGV